jgi:hypothetical protein
VDGRDKPGRGDRGSSGNAECPSSASSPSLISRVPILNRRWHSRGAIDRPDHAKHCPSSYEGAGKAGRWLHPQPRVRKIKHTSVVTTGFTGHPGLPCASGFNGLFRALVSAKSGRMCERAVLVKPPVAESEPVRAQRPLEPAGERGTDPVSSSTRTVARALSPNRARKGAG